MNLKNIKFIFLLSALAIAVVSCSESDKVIDEITDNVTRGAVLRQVDVMSNSLAINADTEQFETGEQFAVLLEYQDTEDGSLLSELEVYAAFNDKTEDNGDNSVSEMLVESIPASDFTTGDRDLPQLSYSLTGTQMLSALGLANTDVVGGDEFNVRFEVVLTDGRRFSSANNSGTITGSYFASPFLNNIAVVCAPTVPTAGTWIFETSDSYGDGWNGASLAVTLDGALAETIVNGSTDETFEVEVPAGTQTISIIFTSGDWDGEISFTITSANGNEVVVATPPPVAGVELLDYCKGGL